MMTQKQADIPGAKEAAARGSYALDPVGATGGPDTNDNGGGLVGYDRRLNTWHAPFIMYARRA